MTRATTARQIIMRLLRFTLPGAALFGIAAPTLAQSPAARQAPSQTIEEIVVTGSYIGRPTQADSPAPLRVITQDDINDLGVNEIGDVIERLTINTGSQNNPDAFTQNFTTGTSNVNLRGLGVSSTLVMINGRRQTQSAIATDRGENFVDTSSLPPMIVFDRIETLKDGATALYGSDAVAGVVNFITRSDFVGFDLELDYQAVDAHPQEDSRISGLFGAGDGPTHFLAAFSFLDRAMLTTNDRRLSGPTDDLSRAGNPGSFVVPTLPGNPAYASVWTGAFDSDLNGVADAVQPQLGYPAVLGANVPVFADPDCEAIAAQDPKVVPAIAASVPSPVGAIPIGLCQFDFGSYYSIVPEEQRQSAYFSLAHDFSDRVEGFVELHVANNEATRNNSPSFPFADFPTVFATHPDNPYGTDVRFIGRVKGAGGQAVQSVHDSDTWRLAASLSGDIDAAWGWELGLQTSRNEFFVAAPDVLVDRFDYAMQGLGGPGCDPLTGTPGVGDCAYFNPFGSALTGTGTVNSPALFDDLIAFLSFDAESELTTLDGLVTGELGELAGNPIGIAIGAQLRDASLSYDYNENANRDNFLFLVGNPDFADDRDVSALFAELALPFSETVDVQLAARYEDYGDGVDSTDPKASILWRPTDDFSLRASVGTSFRAPSLYQAFGTQTSLAELVDPDAGTTQFYPVRAQPNPSGEPLQPEGADVLNLGFSWFLTDALEIGIDYWSFDYTNVIIQQNPQAILDAAAAGDTQAQSQVVRDPQTDLLLRVDTYYDNASSLKTDGFDFQISYLREAGNAGDFLLGAEATYVASYDAVDPQAGTIDGAGKRNFRNFATSVPEIRATAFANWSRGNHGANLYVNYIDSYIDDEGGPSALETIASYVTVDAQYNFRFSGDRGPAISVGAINLLDEDPPRVTTNGGYDSKVHDPRGRLFYARAVFAF
ncbi:MAG TPA: TonB-dependent receptor [Gammaproteobacteria bacterium]|nr:TonB-dependent receptor [Gammaproteobacteria bacterium]